MTPDSLLLERIVVALRREDPSRQIPDDLIERMARASLREVAGLWGDVRRSYGLE